MDIRHHPEYDLYHRDADLVVACRDAVATWREDGEPLVAEDGMKWTPDSARTFVEEVGALFKAYNLVLWQSFSYCRRCQGGCCVVGASQVTTFDALALALLDERLPELMSRAADGDCIYLGAQGCRWPQAWRPIKCWSFYCLGSGDWEIDAEDARYARITEALQATVQARLPALLKRRGVSLHQFLADPIAFAEALGVELYDIFVAPFASGYGLAADKPRAVAKFALREAKRSPEIHEARAFIAGAVEALWQDPATDEQFLADLESLEWILAQRPPHAQEAIQTLSQHYPERSDRVSEAGAGALRAQMGLILQKLLRDPALPPARSL